MKIFGCIALSTALMLPALSGCGSHAGTDDSKPETVNTVECGGFTVEEAAQGGSISLYSATIESTENGVFESSEISTYAASNTYTLTAVTSDGYTDIVYSSAWANSSSSWASGKVVTDYVTVTPNENNARVSTVECLQAFGEPIVITAKRQDNAESASVQCDYVRKLSTSSTSRDAFFGTHKLSNGGCLRNSDNGLILDGVTPFSFVWNWAGSYTVQGDFQITKIDLNYRSTGGLAFINKTRDSDYFAEAKKIRSDLAFANASVMSNVNLAPGVSDWSYSSPYSPFFCMTCNVNFSLGDWLNIGSTGYANLKQTKPECAKYLQWAAQEGCGQGALSCVITYSYKYQGKTIDSGTVTVNDCTRVGFNGSAIAAPTE